MKTPIEVIAEDLKYSQEQHSEGQRRDTQLQDAIANFKKSSKEIKTALKSNSAAIDILVDEADYSYDHAAIKSLQEGNENLTRALRMKTDDLFRKADSFAWKHTSNMAHWDMTVEEQIAETLKFAEKVLSDNQAWLFENSKRIVALTQAIKHLENAEDPNGMKRFKAKCEEMTEKLKVTNKQLRGQGYNPGTV